MPSVCLCLRVRLCVGWCSDCGVWSSLSLSLSLSESRLAHVYSGYIGDRRPTQQAADAQYNVQPETIESVWNIRGVLCNGP